MAVLKRWRSHAGENLAGKAVTWTVRKYVWRGPCARSPWSEKNMRPVIVQDDNGLYRVGMRNARSDKPHLHEVEYSPRCYSTLNQAAISATAERGYAELWHEFCAKNAHTFKAPKKAETQRPRMRR